ncbi:MAG TPA: flavin reductase family protein [Virgibacillus sp.]|nr:flavin reductase family protein [Virgibacillus sp.]
MIDDRVFRDAMGKFATGITVVTTKYNEEIMGMTVNAFMSVSLNPKLIAISIDEKATMYNILQETNSFGVSMLRDDQQDVSMVFAKQKDSNCNIKFTYQNNIPVLEDGLVTLSCRVQQQTKAGDHMIFFAEVTEIQLNDGQPVLYYGGEYRTIQPK